MKNTKEYIETTFDAMFEEALAELEAQSEKDESEK